MSQKQNASECILEIHKGERYGISNIGNGVKERERKRCCISSLIIHHIPLSYMDSIYIVIRSLLFIHFSDYISSYKTLPLEW
jgi:hypothetical protein